MGDLKEEKDKVEIKPDGGLYKNVKVTKKGLDIFLVVSALLVILGLVLWFIFS